MATQYVVNGLSELALVILVGTAFQLLLWSDGYFHFALGAVVAVGGYGLLAAHAWGVPPAGAVLLGVGASVAVSAISEWSVFRSLRARRATGQVKFLASLGLFFVTVNVLALAFGDGTRSVRDGVASSVVVVAGAHVKTIQLVMMSCAVLGVLSIAAWLRFTPGGLFVRAYADEPRLACLGARDPRIVHLHVHCIAGALAGVAGVLMASDVDIRPRMGMAVLFLAVAGVLIGGAGSVVGVVVGGLVIVGVRVVVISTLGTIWSDAATFAVLAACLVVRPGGLIPVRGPASVRQDA